MILIIQLLPADSIEILAAYIAKLALPWYSVCVPDECAGWIVFNPKGVPF